MFQRNDLFNEFGELSERHLEALAEQAAMPTNLSAANAYAVVTPAGAMVIPQVPDAIAFSGARLGAVIPQVVSGSGVLEWRPPEPPFFDTSGFFYAVTPTILTIPVTGYYQVGLAVRWGRISPAAGYCSAFIVTLEGDILAASQVPAFEDNNGGNDSVCQECTGPTHLAQGDTLTMRVYQTTGLSLDASSGSVATNGISTQCWITLLAAG